MTNQGGIMALSINIEQLLDATTIESARIEYKEGWNPDAIYRTICAFANDFDNTGGGYILVGVKEEKGHAVRPVKGIELDKIEPIEKEMIGYNNLLQPAYYPKTSIEDVDGKKILVIWVPGGTYRPYKVPDEVTARNKRFNYYIRYNSSSLIAKGEFERELIELTNQIPFDDRANQQATLKDVSRVLVSDFLVKANSRLADEVENTKFSKLLEQMDLVAGPSETLRPKNVALMMFSENPAKFFPYTQVDIVIFPKGKLEDPSNFIEVPSIKGPINKMINEVMTYLRTNIIKEKVHKPGNRPESIRCFNYPMQALEEAVVNALYHRDYLTREPVEIAIEPHCIRIVNYGGPDRSIRMDDLNRGLAHSRRYRNRKLGDFLKELNLTEGKATGIPTIIKEMKQNGSPMAEFDTDDARSYFLVNFPIHAAFEGEPLLKNQNEANNEANSEANNEANNGTGFTERQLNIIAAIRTDDAITRTKLTKLLKVSKATIERDLKILKEMGILHHEGSSRFGKWVLDL